ncbi:hypothetical protein NDU88_004277 [Pleurodeles waltl]|uniref:Uncharacterized protein n=1 Tax=Pleurodeles waltl TaxID=8319 RepID=A0AAV7TRI5_PLEWA|nr:hypothetical protein NDU88_004277 [Pleurodeles waltl]
MCSRSRPGTPALSAARLSLQPHRSSEVRQPQPSSSAGGRPKSRPSLWIRPCSFAVRASAGPRSALDYLTSPALDSNQRVRPRVRAVAPAPPAVGFRPCSTAVHAPAGPASLWAASPLQSPAAGLQSLDPPLLLRHPGLRRSWTHSGLPHLSGPWLQSGGQAASPGGRPGTLAAKFSPLGLPSFRRRSGRRWPRLTPGRLTTAGREIRDTPIRSGLTFQGSDRAERSLSGTPRSAPQSRHL